MNIILSDHRAGHDGIATGGSYGPHSFLVTSPNAIVREVSRLDESKIQTGNRMNSHQYHLEVRMEVEVEGDGFVFLVEGFSANPYLDRPATEPKIGLVAGEHPGFFPPERYARVYREWEAAWTDWESARDGAAYVFVLEDYADMFRVWDQSVSWYWEPTQARKAWIFLSDPWKGHPSIAGQSARRALAELPPAIDETPSDWDINRGWKRIKAKHGSIPQFLGFHFKEAPSPPEKDFVTICP